jgi:N-acetylglucosamine-6-sulfatase
VVRGTRPAPGWDRWLAQLNSRRYYDYKLSNDGRVVKKGSRRRDHLTGVITRAVSRYLDENLSRRKPLFLQLHQYAPHIGAAPGVAGGSRCAAAPEPSPRDRRTIKDRVAPRSPSFNEADVSDKPYYFQPPPLDAVQLESVDRRYRCTLESLAGVDRSVKRIFKRLHKAGELRNTAFVFLTDNGFFLGEHRIRKGKARPWEEAIRTPLVVRPPRAFGELGAEVAEQVGSIDVVPTILDLAGAEPCRGGRCRAMDGRSLLPPMRGRVGELRDRALLIEMADNSRDPRDFACHFEALRTSDDVLIRNTEFPDPDTRQCEPGVLYEHYAIDADPFQLGNRIGPTGLPAAPRQLRLADRLDRLRGCSGIEDRDPATSGGWCD